MKGSVPRLVHCPSVLTRFLLLGLALLMTDDLRSAEWVIPGPEPVYVTNLDRYFTVELDHADPLASLTTSNATVNLIMTVGKQRPESIAVFVGREEEKNPRNSPAKWIPYADKVRVDLGDGDGQRHIFVAARWQATDPGYWGNGFGMTVWRTKPPLFITNPAQTITFQPMIQLKGYSSRPLQSIKYDLLNQQGQKIVSDQDGFVTRQYFDEGLFEFTTNYFQCYDIELAPGTNIIVLRCSDPAGNWTTTNLIYVFTTVGDTNPPVFNTVDWPEPGATLSGESFTARGRVDDYTGQMAGQIVANGHTNVIRGEPERNGYFWYEQIPLAPGANQLTLTATDAAGNTSTTNFTIYGVAGPVITLDPITPAEILWDPTIRLTGKVSPANNNVWVNGVQAVVKPDGSWIAESVPVLSPNGGTAVFEMMSTPSARTANPAAKPFALVAAQASFSTNPFVLNASSPACGVFKLHLVDTAGRSFVLQSSTNLIDWLPILTNLDSAAAFDYTDTNVTSHLCRFFRVVPLQ